MSILDFHINEGYVPMLDGSLVYHRGFGERRTTLSDVNPSLFMGPRVFTTAPPKGTRRHSTDAPLYDTATETLIAPYSIDPRWHELNHAAVLSGDDAGLNRFDPKHFVLLGGTVPHPAQRGQNMGDQRDECERPQGRRRAHPRPDGECGLLSHPYAVSRRCGQSG
ncbi:hypothetical protein M8J71_10170 [Pseudarthrobacter sp. R1]|uniref:hypothetical protein n=1 Tax=Pseudarthrobacter sp. R1 TaxID=2944934 RepID=UPI002109F740|nr:hypothetical protein [Pseudarthrobacter sp. R1]MCQ6270846.1 hypothetical protein [Pseudarthrobacter sp. R1]